MPVNPPKYSPDQRRAIIRAGLDMHIRPMSRIAAMAANGELRAEADEPALPAFQVPASSVRAIIKLAERRRAGDVRKELAQVPIGDRIDLLQRRLTSLVDVELERLERRSRGRPNLPLDAEQARKIAKALRELATLPDPQDRRLPMAPGERTLGSRGNPARDSLAGKLLAASDRSSAPYLSPQPETGETAPEETTPVNGAALDPHRQTSSN